MYNTIGEIMKKAELLIPVGNYENLLSAIHNGADAVYLGGKKFGARAFSNNFTKDELEKATKLCHLYNVKIYITVNTMIYNDEISEFLDYINFLNTINVDAVIMQDLGMIELVRKHFKNLEIHISTQAHNHNDEALKHFKEIGCSRVVFDREMSLEEINELKTPIEKEIFVYGALCICYSGNCLFSALNGGRSANRGECVGSCRLPYKLYNEQTIEDEGYLLSTKDLNTLPYLQKILSSNIDSLKIEGRMKSKEYVAIVTKTFRKLIDNYYDNKDLILTFEEINNLKKVYNREYTKGYLFNASNITNKNTSNHQGTPLGTIISLKKDKLLIKLEDDIHQEDAIRFEKANQGTYINLLYNEKGLLINSAKKGSIIQIDNKFNYKLTEIKNTKVRKTIDKLLIDELNNYKEKKLPLEIDFNTKNQTAILTISHRNISVTKTKDIVSKAISKPLDEDKILKQLSKTGETPFFIQNYKINIENNIFINIKDLNELRRDTIGELITLLETSSNKPQSIQPDSTPLTISKKINIAILTRTEEQLKVALKNNINYIYVTDEELYKKYHPTNNSIYLRLPRINQYYHEYNNENLLCTEFGSIIKYNQNNNIHSDYCLNIANEYSIDKLSHLNTSNITLSIELTIEKLQKIKNKEMCSVLIYGYPECMIIKNNIFNIEQKNQKYLLNTKNEKFPLEFEHKNTVVFNHEKINLLNSINKIPGFNTYRIDLYNESAIETQNIINKLYSNLKDML